MKKTKVVLLGDSIRLMGYGSAVPALLSDGFEVWQPESNGRFVSNVLRDLFDMAEQIDKADIVHFNSGEWDVCDLFGDGPFTPEGFYVSQLLRIVDILQAKGKTVIFATTTPVRSENQHNHNDVIERYNAAAVPLLRKKGVAINDLWAVVNENVYENVCDDTIHLSPIGIERCAASTAEAIRRAAEERKAE
ncbi:MAG: SGNH/GDSL hydrolase family protein [Clostridia bacterium]|nr:SGNH/GDSL hydrolase family protein [Clostridia bacterium]